MNQTRARKKRKRDLLQQLLENLIKEMFSKEKNANRKRRGEKREKTWIRVRSRSA